MAISPDPTIPDVIYLDEQAIDDIFSYLGQGTVSEIIQRVSSQEEEGSEVGFAKILIARLSTRSVEGQETEFVRTLDPIGKLAMLRATLREDDLVTEIGSGVTEETRDALDRGNIVEMETELLRTPIEELETTIAQFLDFHENFADLIDIDMEDVDEVEEVQQIISALNREGDILRARAGSDNAFDFVLTYEDNGFRNPGLGFPRQGINYTVLGQTTMKFDQDDSISLINFTDLASRVVDNPHESRRKMVEMRKQFASSASQICGRDVNTSEFEISHPDVEMKPLAIYR